MRLSKVLPLAALVLAGAFSLRADEASKTAKILELLQVTKSDQMLKQSLDQVRQMQTAELSKAQLSSEDKAKSAAVFDKINKAMADRLSWDNLKPQFIKLYSDLFTEEEIVNVLGFYKSPAGQAFLTKMPMLMKRSMALGQAAMADFQEEMQKILKESNTK